MRNTISKFNYCNRLYVVAVRKIFEQNHKRLLTSTVCKQDIHCQAKEDRTIIIASMSHGKITIKMVLPFSSIPCVQCVRYRIMFEIQHISSVSEQNMLWAYLVI